MSLEIEDKLNQLKDEFCKWKCFHRGIDISCGCINICDYCPVIEFIRHIRDEI